jgi:hypothetical protein
VIVASAIVAMVRIFAIKVEEQVGQVSKDQMPPGQEGF